MKKILSLIILASLVGCTSTPKKTSFERSTTSPRWQHHLVGVSQIQQWQAQGKIAARKGNKGSSASFIWQQTGDYYKIKIFGPFGAGAVYVQGNNQYVELKEANGRLTKGTSAEHILQQIMGWAVPVSGLRYWLMGLPSPKVSVQQQQTDQMGRLKNLAQSGWRIHYDNYQPYHTLSLPQKLQLYNHDISIKMIIKSWQ